MQPTNEYEALKAGRRLIANKDRWCKGSAAITIDGSPTEPADPEAVRWCAIGAQDKVCPDPCNGYQYLFTAAKMMGYGSVAAVNDDADHAAVMRMYDLAIAYAQEARA